MFIELSLVVFAFVRSSKEMLKDWTQPTVIFERGLATLLHELTTPRGSIVFRTPTSSPPIRE